ncbi:TPA: DUF362 domain-containing protein [Candidatus Poribacteria bacterium]|nr:DUF362 domain-containing protein [Candidatus Poribacteria bacterium]
MSEPKFNRRDFIKNTVAAGIAFASFPLLGYSESKTPSAQVAKKDIGLAIATGSDDPKKLVQAAIDAVGGMGQFVSRGDIVVVKPNIGWSRTPEQAANTNPYIVEKIVELCLNAGAKKVKVFDRTCNRAKTTYRRSGIEAAVKRVGGDIKYVDERKFKEVKIPQGKRLKSWRMYIEALDADVLINVPIAKHHSTSRLTMAMKNLMGVLGGNRGDLHNQLGQNLADINTVIKPNLTILDAYRILTAHGPNSGTPDDVKLTKQVIVGTDPVAVDSYGATLFGLTGQDLDFVRIGHEMELGEMDLNKVALKTIEVGG